MIIFLLTNCQEKDNFIISKNDINIIKKEAMKACVYKNEFDKLFAAWKKDWQTNSKTIYSSNTNDAKTLETYYPLLNKGDTIIPLLMEKLLDKDNFFAVVLFEDIQKTSSLRINYKLGEQDKVIIIIKHWIRDRGD